MPRALTLAVLLALAGAVQPTGAEPLKRVRIGATPGPHAQILEAVKAVAAKNGLDLRIVEFADYVVPNEAPAADEIEANSFPNLPLGIDSKRHRSFEAEPNGDTVAIQNDPTNMADAPCGSRMTREDPAEKRHRLQVAGGRHRREPAQAPLQGARKTCAPCGPVCWVGSAQVFSLVRACQSGSLMF